LTAAFNSYLIGFILVQAGRFPGVLVFIAGASAVAMLVVAFVRTFDPWTGYRGDPQIADLNGP